MQLKNTRQFTLVEALEGTLNQVPIGLRHGLAIEFDISEKILRKNLEAIYLLATQRLLHLSYYLEWSRTIEGNEELKPESFDSGSVDYVGATICTLEIMNPEQLKFLNGSFTNWINNQVVRELSEFLKHYLAELHEMCTVLEYTKSPITPRDTVDIKAECKKFEKGGMQERLGILRRKFGFNLTHNKEILSLYDVRNIFAHSDGVVMKKFCNKDGYVEISWPQNTYKYKKRGKDEWVSYHKIRRPFSSDMYESIQVTWLNKPEIRKYKPMEQIKLSYQDLSNLVFFYLFVFNELHKRLVEIVQERGIKVKPFKKYILNPSLVGVMSANEN